VTLPSSAAVAARFTVAGAVNVAAADGEVSVTEGGLPQRLSAVPSNGVPSRPMAVTCNVHSSADART
jgi:hypothetical protein